MSYPATAFMRCTGESASDGALLFVRGYWTLAARTHTPDGVKPATLILTGSDAGKVHGRFSDSGLCTSAEVSVEVRIVNPASVVTDESYPRRAGLVIPADGLPEIWGATPGAEGSRQGFKLNGSPVSDSNGHPYLFFPSYEVWLTKGGKPLSNEPLFVVGEN